MEDIFKELQKLGFSPYECKAYTTLLKTSPITGYEISKRSGVPRSMIYEVLGKLLDKGAVNTVPSDPITYVPLAAKELVQRLRASFEQSFSFLEQNLSALEGEREADVIRRIQSDGAVMDEMQQMIAGASEEIWLSVWEPQAQALSSAISRREAEGVLVYSILFGDAQTRVGVTFHHDYMVPEVVEERMGGRLTILVRDQQEVLIANFSAQAAAWAVKTEDPALVLVALEYIRHDIMLGEVIKALGPDKVEAMWRTKPDLFHIVTGRRFN